MSQGWKGFTQAIWLLAAAASAPAATADTPAGPVLYSYDVTLPGFGRIGTYETRITPQGTRTEVETEIEVEVKVAFVTAFSLSADRREVWEDGRLVAFDGTTTKNGEVIRLEAEAGEDTLVVDGPRGTDTVAPDVVTFNPWSTHVLDADLAMSPEHGGTWPIAVSPGGEGEIELGAETLDVRHYRIEGEEPSDLWFDADGRPVRFSIEEDGRTLTFTLAPERSAYSVPE